MPTNLRFAAIAGLLALFLLFSADLSLLEICSISFTLFTFLVFLHEIGNSIAIRELMAFTVSLQMLFAPTLELIQTPDAMAVSSDKYLSYAFPATVIFIIGLFTPIIKTRPHRELLILAREYLNGKERTSFILLILGVTGSILFEYAPIQIKNLIYLFAICLYASVLYSHYSNNKFKYINLFTALSLLLYITVRDGMFGYMIFWISLYILVTLVSSEKKIGFSYKLILVILCVFFIILAQSIKMEYRMITWGDNKDNRKADPELMLGLMGQRLKDLSILLGNDHLAATYHRLNQGVLIAETMAYVPRYEPFANGELITHLFYPFIPRIIWSDKPITGGEANILRFTPLIPNGISSSNISPFGEAYVNFGESGGIFFLLFFGILFNLAFSSIIKLSESTPSLLLWLPCLFTGCLTFETDVLSVWGSFATTSTFLAFFWFTSKRINIML